MLTRDIIFTDAKVDKVKTKSSLVSVGFNALITSIIEEFITKPKENYNKVCFRVLAEKGTKKRYSIDILDTILISNDKNTPQKHITPETIESTLRYKLTGVKTSDGQSSRILKASKTPKKVQFEIYNICVLSLKKIPFRGFYYYKMEVVRDGYAING